ncbi:MAG: hypothetical protein ABIL25_01220 [candidate division WOR-3 bacterium]
MRRLTGDVLRINITPAGKPGRPGTFPWIRVYRHPHGIKRPASYDRPPEGVNATKDKPRDQLAKEIGEAVIKSSRVLKSWLRPRVTPVDVVPSSEVAEGAHPETWNAREISC